MKTALAVSHLPFEHLGTLAPLLERRGYRLLNVDATRQALHQVNAANVDLLVMLGGPIGAGDEALYPFIHAELAMVQQRLQTGGALLGICLGAQLIARAAGARVYAMGSKEIGFGPLTLTGAGQTSPLAELQQTPVLHWHGDQFDIPSGAIHLAGTAQCPHQAFSIGSQVLALQCHLEAVPDEIERWLVGHACEIAQAGIDPRTLRHQAAELRERLPVAATAVFSRWLDGIEQ